MERLPSLLDRHRDRLAAGPRAVIRRRWRPRRTSSSHCPTSTRGSDGATSSDSLSDHQVWHARSPLPVCRRAVNMFFQAERGMHKLVAPCSPRARSQTNAPGLYRSDCRPVSCPRNSTGPPQFLHRLFAWTELFEQRITFQIEEGASRGGGHLRGRSRHIRLPSTAVPDPMLLVIGPLRGGPSVSPPSTATPPSRSRSSWHPTRRGSSGNAGPCVLCHGGLKTLGPPKCDEACLNPPPGSAGPPPAAPTPDCQPDARSLHAPGRGLLQAPACSSTAGLRGEWREGFAPSYEMMACKHFAARGYVAIPWSTASPTRRPEAVCPSQLVCSFAASQNVGRRVLAGSAGDLARDPGQQGGDPLAACPAAEHRARLSGVSRLVRGRLHFRPGPARVGLRLR